MKRPLYFVKAGKDLADEFAWSFVDGEMPSQTAEQQLALLAYIANTIGSILKDTNRICRDLRRADDLAHEKAVKAREERMGTIFADVGTKHLQDGDIEKITFWIAHAAGDENVFDDRGLPFPYLLGRVRPKSIVGRFEKWCRWARGIVAARKRRCRQ